MITHFNGSRKLTGEDFNTANTYTYGETFAKVDSQDLVALIQYVFKQIKTLPVNSEPVTTTRATTTTTTTTARTTTTTKVTAPIVGFDPQIYVDYAIEYGESIGLIYSRDLVGDGGDNPRENASWGSPIVLNDTLDHELMKLSISSRCDRMVEGGYKSFWAELDDAGDMYFLLYIYR